MEILALTDHFTVPAINWTAVTAVCSVIAVFISMAAYVRVGRPPRPDWILETSWLAFESYNAPADPYDEPRDVVKCGLRNVGHASAYRVTLEGDGCTIRGRANEIDAEVPVGGSVSFDVVFTSAEAVDTASVIVRWTEPPQLKTRKGKWRGGVKASKVA